MSFGGFGAKPAAGVTGFGVTSAAGSGFGSATGTGFGGAAPAAGAGGFGAKPATATATTGGSFGFGGAAATPATGSGFGGSTPAVGAGGFGAAAGGGFGAKPVTAALAFGTPGGATGFGTTAGTGGFGAGRSSFGLGGTTGGGFGGLGTTTAAAPANAAPTAAQFPYPGIKGPGNAMSWAREVDFSQVTEQTLFESLPQPLQQHLMELRSFMHAEREAAKKVYDYLNESDKTGTVSASAASGVGGASAEAAAASYRGFLSKLAALKGDGNRAVDIVAVHCNQHEGQARRQLQRMEKLEASVREYERHVWEPLLEQGLPLSNSGTGSASSPRGGSYRAAVSNDATSPFAALVEELSRRLDSVSEELASLEATLVPSGRPLRGPGSVDRQSRRGGSAIPSDPIAQINASLLYELNQLRDFSCVVAHLHSRTDTARELFTRQYGQAEADVLFTDTETQRNGIAAFRRAAATSYFDIPPLPQQRLPPAAPAAGGFAALATSTLGGFGAKPAATATTTTTTGGFGTKPATTTTGVSGGGGFGFGVAASTAPGAATGTASTAATVGAAPSTIGFGAPAAPAASSAAPTGGFGAPAGGFGAPVNAGTTPAAPAVGPALPAGAPSSFNLGGSATGAIGFGGGPGKSTANGDDRPTRRAR